MKYTLSKYSLILGIVLAIAMPVLVYSAESKSVTLNGQIGSSSKWGSGWLNLTPATDFAKGDLFQLKIGGTSNKILVRLLAKGQSSDSSVGIIGDAITVPKNRIVKIKLDSAQKGIIQISVHGGPNPWGKFPLGGANGPATLEAVKLIRN